MSMEHRSVSVDIFAERLRDMLNKRLDMFVRYAMLQKARNPEDSGVKTKRQWMAEYQNWSAKDDVAKMCLEYLLED